MSMFVWPGWKALNIFKNLQSLIISHSVLMKILMLSVFFCLSDPGWTSINRGVLICDECCSVHRSLGRHISIVKHLRHSGWPPSLLQVSLRNEERRNEKQGRACETNAVPRIVPQKEELLQKS